MVAARLHGLVDDRVEVQEPGGVLALEWDGAGNVFLTGPAAYVQRRLAELTHSRSAMQLRRLID